MSAFSTLTFCIYPIFPEREISRNPIWAVWNLRISYWCLTKVPSLPIFNTNIFSEWNFVSPESLSWSVFWISWLLWVVFPWPHGSKSAGTSAPVILIEGCSDHCSRNQAWFKNQDQRTLSLSFRAACFISEWTILFIIRTLDRLYQWMEVYRTKMSSLNFFSYTTPSDDFS